MKKLRILAVAAVAMIAICAQAGEKGYFGVRAAFNATTSTKLTQISGWGPGASVGGIYHYNISKPIYAQFGLSFDYNTIKIDGENDNKYNRQKYDGHLDIIGLRLPINLGFNLYQNSKVCLSAYTGPELFFNFSVKRNYDLTYNSTTTHVDGKLTGSGMDIAWMLGVGVDIMHNWHVHVEGAYGLSDLGETDGMAVGKKSHFKRAEISVGLGYNF